MTLELVDYSRTNDDNWDKLAAAIKAAGKVGVGRYCVDDLAPNGRGISAPEYAAYVAEDLSTFLYWESSEGWMLGGYNTGIAAAKNAQKNIAAAGMPLDTAVYFACDFDATPEQQAQIDDTLRGCASVMGLPRTKIYGGFYVVKRCMENGTASGACQTTAWSGGQVYEGACLLQYSYNAFIDNTNCDLVRAFTEDYGQVGYTKPVVTTTPAPYPKPELPDWYARVKDQEHPSAADWNGTRWYPERANVKALKETYVYVRPDTKSPHAGPPTPEGTKVGVDWKGEIDGKLWSMGDDGYRPLSQYDPQLKLPEAR